MKIALKILLYEGKCLPFSLVFKVFIIHIFLITWVITREVTFNCMSINFAPKEKLWFVLLDGTNTVLFYSLHKAQCLAYMEKRL